MADPPVAAVHIEEEHLDVERSQEIFHELERELSTRSESDGNRLGYTGVSHGHDLEKSCDDGGRFNLRDFLQSSNNANQSAGIKHKHVGVTWNDLEVEVVGGADFKIYIGTFGAEIINFFLFPILYVWRFILTIICVKSAQLPTRTILHKQSGVVKPGEMCLVLGCPGAGCTTFLKAIANERHEFIRVGGDVRYAGIDAAEMERTYKGEVAYNEEDDRHIPTLTVVQTISFALSTKTPGPNGRLPGLSRAEFNEKVENMLLRMLNISHTKQTYVGDEFVRGVSGGERKRVSIAETMATRARVLCFDNSTRGLDASTALDFIKAMRAMTDILGQTMFATLYQAGEGIYALFDKVLVLDKGRQVFFGPPSEARAYFENLGYMSLPRQSTADYLTGCTDPNERRFAPGRSLADVPASPEALEAAFCSSSYASEMQLSLEKYKDSMDTEKQDQITFKEAVAAEKKRGVSKKSPYTVGFFGQVKALVKRNLQTRMQDKFTLVTSYTLTTILAFIIGGAYFNQPLNAAGAFTRGSVMFYGIMTSCLETFAELPAQMLGRPILKKQTSYSFYRPSATVIANTLADMPFSFVRMTIYNVIIYFMSNLNRNGGAFMVWELFTCLAFLTMQGFFRTFGLMCSSFDTAFRLSMFCLPNIIQYIGYMIPVQEMKRWLFWIYYINPLSYVFSGVVENEFHRINLSCDGSYVVPRNLLNLTKYPDALGPNQACTLSGSEPGSPTVTGAAYLKAGYSLNIRENRTRSEALRRLRSIGAVGAISRICSIRRQERSSRSTPGALWRIATAFCSTPHCTGFDGSTRYTIIVAERHSQFRQFQMYLL